MGTECVIYRFGNKNDIRPQPSDVQQTPTPTVVQGGGGREGVMPVTSSLGFCCVTIFPKYLEESF